MSKASQGYQQGVEAERKRCVGVLVREVLHEKKYAWRHRRRGAFQAAGRRFMRALSLMLLARELYGPRKGDDNGNG